MRKHILKAILLFALAAGTVSSMALVSGVPASSASERSGPTIMPFAEETGYKYQTVNGVRFRRLWSYTYCRWIDTAWTVCP